MILSGSSTEPGKPLTCVFGWANDKTLLVSGYVMLGRGWSRLKRADLPAFWVVRAVRRV
jgi:hypothetical protein